MQIVRLIVSYIIYIDWYYFLFRYDFYLHVNRDLSSKVNYIIFITTKVYFHLIVVMSLQKKTKYLHDKLYVNIWFNFVYCRWWIMHNSVARSSHALLSRQLSTILNSCSSPMIISICWGLALSVSLPPLFGWSHFAPESNGLR